MNIIPYLNFQPKVASTCSSEVGVYIIGQATVGDRCHFQDLVTLRADGATIDVGADCWFGEYATAHIADRTSGVLLADNVTIGRFGLAHACTIGKNCILGEHAVVMDNAIVGNDSVICSDSVVPPGKKLEPGWLYRGVPAKPIRKIENEELENFRNIIKSRKNVTGAEWVLSSNPVPEIRHTPGEGVARNQGDDFYIAPNAIIKGKVSIAAQSSIWFAVEIDAEDATIQIGAASNIQDNSRITLEAGERLKIGNRVTVGHNVQLNTCDIGNDCIIGMGSKIGKGTVVQNGGVVAAGAVTAPDTTVTEGMIWSGNPAKQSRPLSQENKRFFSLGVDVYTHYARNYKQGS
ncbi:MAG: hypothetical protein H2061_08055 [Burkholderiales bacterium]|nr:hypothetical protein [Burkholderiales bacterium]